MSDLQRWTDLALSPLKAAGETLLDLPGALTRERRRIAVTGLQRSGKTVFITAFVHALVSAKVTPAKALPFFPFVKKVRDVSLHDMPGIARFDYEAHLAALRADPPRWPSTTRDLSAVRVRLHHDPQTFLGRRLSSTATLDIDLIDYPGEWLIDLPLLTQSYGDWSRRTEDLAAAPCRQDFAAAWRTDAAQIDLEAPEDPRALAKVGRLYVDYLRFCRAERHLFFLQPGRFLQDATVLDDALFFPVARLDRPKRGSNGAALVRRYEAYRSLVRQFYGQVFGRLRRQVVLIDVLSALQHGHDSFADLALAVRTISESFEAQTPTLARLLPFTGLDRLALVATKADHVTADQVLNLVGLLQDMVGTLMIGANAGVAGFQAVASVKATTDAVKPAAGGMATPVLVGIPAGKHSPVGFRPGIIPGKSPDSTDWPLQLDIRDVEPPRLQPLPGAPLPHINLDKILQFLLA